MVKYVLLCILLAGCCSTPEYQDIEVVAIEPPPDFQLPELKTGNLTPGTSTHDAIKAMVWDIQVLKHGILIRDNALDAYRE